MGINPENNEQSAENVNQITEQLSPKKYIRCPECGEEILMVPTLREMIEAIENHITSHKKHPNNEATLAHVKTPRIRIELTQQVLLQASDTMETSIVPKPSIWL
jgi:DNA-directed RNA polymerase subunit RPC12/RpoP